MKTRSKIVWQPEEIERLLSMIEAGATPARAAVVFKRSITGIQNQARKLGKPFPTIRDRKKAQDAKIEAAERSL